MPPKSWKTLSSRQVYRNPWINVREDIAQMPNGKTTIYGVVECPEAVGVLPFVDDDHVILVRQYRYVFAEDHRWEMPTGAVKPGEPLTEAARRELREEIGFTAADLQFLCTFFSSKSVMREVAHLYIGRGLSQAYAPPDETEFLEVAIFPFTQVLQMTLTSEIRDSMTVIAVLHAARLKGL
ncbi:MAG: NUDIX hydrolase [Chloroflexi bacterium]|nr:MAG: NUDIX hydrolase [Chloroflexota bacterium]